MSVKELYVINVIGDKYILRNIEISPVIFGGETNALGVPIRYWGAHISFKEFSINIPIDVANYEDKDNYTRRAVRLLGRIYDLLSEFNLEINRNMELQEND